MTIREALRELDLWGAAVTFTLTEYTDSSGRTFTLIKDWKDIVNQVDIWAHKNVFTYVYNNKINFFYLCVIKMSQYFGFQLS